MQARQASPAPPPHTLGPKRPVAFAILPAVLYALSAPFAKLLLAHADPGMMAAFLYLGAGLGVWLLLPLQKRLQLHVPELPLTMRDLPYIIAMIVLDIAAPILLLFGLQRTTAANASLLNNFEIVATSLIALLLFREKIKPRLWLAIALVSLASFILSFENLSSLAFSPGSLLVLAAAVAWGFENSCTRMLSAKNPLHITIIKGLGSGTGAFLVANLAGEILPALPTLALILLLGFVAYGLSILFYIYAQRDLGAAKTSTFYAVAPFIGVVLSFIFFRNMPRGSFFVALALMLIGTYFAATDRRRAA